MNKKWVVWGTFQDLCDELASKIPPGFKSIYGIPTGGSLVALRLSKILDLLMVDCPIDGSTLVVDDIVDSGETLYEYRKYYTASLYYKPHSKVKPRAFVKIADNDVWVNFPYEEENRAGEDIVRRMIQYVGEDCQREGLIDTPKRVVKAWEELFEGYTKDPKEILSVGFQEGSCGEMVILKSSPFYSICEHHLLPFFGVISVGYLPNDKVVGISKLSRLVKVFSRRMQIQERMTSQIADTLMDVTKPKGVMVLVEAKHLCMAVRGIKESGSSMITSAIRGDFEDEKVRQEFLSLIDRR
jgi:GTP cyclohydrolase I